jgi:hypothetical protein
VKVKRAVENAESIVCKWVESTKSTLMLHKILIVLCLAAIAFISAACGGSPIEFNGVLPQDYNGIDPVFREDFNMLGGEEVLGPAISPVFEKNGIFYQYTAAALMVRDPNATNGRVFKLADLGSGMGITQPKIPKPENPDGRFEDGHVINSAFLPLYERLEGKRYVGSPISEIYFDPDTQRHEQYFENLGMYWLEGEGPEHVHLLNYGVWECNASCRSRKDLSSGRVELPPQTVEVFKEAVARLGADFTGFAITEAYQTPDGYTEQVFENLVLVADPETPSHVFVRPIVKSLGYKADPLTQNSGKKGDEFYPVTDGLGYNIPQQFVKYIARHGGMDASGPPITELLRTNNNLECQCFTNVCLEMLPQSSGAISVHPAQLGIEYILQTVHPVRLQGDKAASQPTQSVPENPTPPNQPPPAPEATVASFSNSQSRELSMRVWESYSLLAPNQNQEIGVSLLENNTPMPNVEPYLLLTFPEGQERTYYMFPTGEDGVTKMLLDPIDLPNGTRIDYQVCIIDLTYEKYCVKDSFMVWQNP